VTEFVTMLDSIRVTAGNIPRATAKVAGYVTGSGDVPWTAATWAMFPKSAHVRIDQEPGTGVPAASDVADYEPLAKTLAGAVAWLRDRDARGWWSTVYVGEPDNETYSLARLEAAIKLARITRVSYWLCRPDLDQAEAAALLSSGADGVAAVQWATPASNPTMKVPGGSMTLKEANVDVSVTMPDWFAHSAPK
jgi:hypothetical protein